MVICATETPAPDIAEEQLQEDTWSFANGLGEEDE